MVIFIALLIPVTVIVTGYLTLKAVQLGLRWQVEVKEKRPPTIDNPTKEKKIEKKIEQQQEEMTNILSEWIGGEK